MVFIFLSLFPQMTNNGVKFSYFAPEAKIVFIAGDFNGWGRTPMNKDKEGFWSIEFALKPGRYEYKYIVDGEWVSDPDNPITAGPYGNSVLIIDETGNIVLPYSSNISFKGINRFMMYYSYDSLSSMNMDIKFDINLMLSSVNAWSRLHYTGNSIEIQRAKAKYSTKPLIITGFYNTYLLRSSDPLRLIGNEGVYRDPFGRNYTGAAISDRDNFIFFSNNLNDGSDIAGVRAKAGYKDYHFGITGRFQDWANKVQDTLFQSREKYEMFGFDFNIKGIVFEYAKIFDYNLSYKYNNSGEWRDTTVLSPIVKGIRLFAGYSRKLYNFGIEYEYNKTDYSLASLRPLFKIKRKNFGISLSEVHFLYGRDAPWENLFNHSYISRLRLFEYPTLGYRVMSLMQIKGEKKFGFISLNGILNISKPGFFATYYTSEFTPGIKIGNKFSIGADTRIIRYKWKDFNRTYNDPFVYLQFSPRRGSFLRISYGLPPFDNEDQYRNRNSYLESRGFNLSSLKRYSGVYSIIMNSEEKLAKYNKIEIRAEVRFP